MSDTPRTDAEDRFSANNADIPLVRRDFARQLECELVTANERIHRLEAELSGANKLIRGRKISISSMAPLNGSQMAEWHVEGMT